jgi:hypothetical protein
MHIPQREGPLVTQPPFFTNTGISDRFQVKSIRSNVIYTLSDGHCFAIGTECCLLFASASRAGVMKPQHPVFILASLLTPSSSTPVSSATAGQARVQGSRD